MATFTVLLLGWSLHATAWSGESLSDVNRDAATLAAKVKEIFRARCFECHGGSATQADLDVLDVQGMIDEKVLIAGEPNQSRLLDAVTSDDEELRMPQGSPPLSAIDIELIRQWILAGASSFPPDVVRPKDADTERTIQSMAGIEYVLNEILHHQRTLAIDKRRNVRYFSSHHLLAGGATREELDTQHDAFVKAINHLSRRPQIVHSEVVNGETATIFAVDIRELGWNERPFSLVGKGGSTVSHANLYDLVLLEYPYGILYEDSATFDALATEFLVPAAQVRPIPFVRTDWFCSVALLPPLYHDLLQLPRDLDELEKQLNVAVEHNLAHRQAMRAGMAVSGVSRNNRAVERHPQAHGSYWKSIDYASSKGTENIFIDPVNLHGTGGEMIFNLPNGLQGYFVCDSIGKRLNEAPTSIVTDKFAEDKTVRNGLSCIRCHDQGIKSFRDDVRPAVEHITGSGHIDKRTVLALYPPHEAMKARVTEDQDRFSSAMTKVLKRPQREEPITPVSKRFLDTPLQLRVAAGELGLSEVDELKATFRQPHFTSFGLVALGNSGVVRRDMWEDYFDDVVRSLGLGIPVLPIDGLSSGDHIPGDSILNVHLATSKKNNVFAPGDDLVVTIENRGNAPVFIELYGASAAGEIVAIVAAGTKLEPGQQLRFPESGSIKVRPALGKEQFILFASQSQFLAGQVLRGAHIADRIVHPFYALEVTDRGAAPQHDARPILRRTLEIETR